MKKDDGKILPRAMRGLRTRGPVRALGLLLALNLACSAQTSTPVPEPSVFERISLFPVSRNAPNLPLTAAEILAVTEDGMTIVYADSLGQGLGFVDISDPASPQPKGWMPIPGEPTSVAVAGPLALVVSRDEGPALRGHLNVIDIEAKSLIERYPLKGQPDCIEISPDKRFAAIALENESSTGFPQSPPGSVIVFKLSDDPAHWSSKEVSLLGLADYQGQDPEPEYLAIDSQNRAVVSLQENNHLVVIDLETAEVLNHFSAGSQPLKGVDLKKDKRISLTDQAPALPREPDAVAWSSAGIVTADEGDLRGGSRSFSVFSSDGDLLYSSGSSTEQIARDYGQYPDHRSEAKGTEPESLKVATFDNRELLFLGCERAHLVQVFEILAGRPKFLEALYAGPGPESIVAIPERDLLVLGSEVDMPKKGLRSYLSIYRFGTPETEAAHLVSKQIAWGALSGLTASADQPGRLFTVTDKALRPSRILTVDTTTTPFAISRELVIKDSKGRPLNFDLEGISTSRDGGFWLIHEGKKKSPNLLLRVQESGLVSEEIPLPDWFKKKPPKHGIEGVAEVDGQVYVAFQSGWEQDPEETTRLARYEPSSGTWEFALYPLKDGHFVSGLSPGPGNTLSVLERDKLAREAALHKRIYSLDPDRFEGQLLQKTLAVDLTQAYRQRGLPVVEKIEGLAYDGRFFWVVNDNDATKDSYGETILLKVDPSSLSK